MQARLCIWQVDSRGSIVEVAREMVKAPELHV